ncbi:uncharacterized protein B0P05DRAFT_542629 [Gilbertella persicaria]|uniref:uncharacterized protein n=1 Tax=Gilbertella persicaria TaxID=101096 RepID=UPI00221F1BA5|nr:uncharacterized protein B0P05DRAFT_542629 [Gilbertella persicaria]KAI8078133.1 hypothetical protein B0P05DRAFT_542629 [Gilbertella persicaria]
MLFLMYIFYLCRCLLLFFLTDIMISLLLPSLFSPLITLFLFFTLFKYMYIYAN